MKPLHAWKYEQAKLGRTFFPLPALHQGVFHFEAPWIGTHIASLWLLDGAIVHSIRIRDEEQIAVPGIPSEVLVAHVDCMSFRPIHQGDFVTMRVDLSPHATTDDEAQVWIAIERPPVPTCRP